MRNMSFKISDKMRELCTRINNNTESGKLDFWDTYYFCSVIGMTKMKFGDKEELTEFNKQYAASYSSLRHSIAAMLVTAEINRRGQEIERDNITSVFKKFIDENSSLILNNDGLSTLDRYAEGGLQLIIERGSRIVDRIQFLRTCKEIIDEE